MSKEKTFKNLTLQDKVYLLRKDTPIPEIVSMRITSLSISHDNRITISFSGHASLMLSLEKDKKNRYENKFISRADAEQALEKLCTERIIELSKALGNISK